MKVVAVIPCFNEEKTIADVVAGAKRHCHRVIVVDNMSSDDTKEEAERETPCYNIHSCYIKGAGAATAYGLIHSLNPLKHLYGDVIVTLDGDGQHNPDDIPKIVKPILDGEADVVVGSRYGDGGMPRYRYAGNKVISWLYNVGARQKVGDVTCGFRAFSREAVSKIAITEKKFGFLAETLTKARVNGFRITEVPIQCIYHERFEDNSSMPPLRMGLSMAWSAVKWRIKLELPRLLKRDRRCAT